MRQHLDTLRRFIEGDVDGGKAVDALRAIEDGVADESYYLEVSHPKADDWFRGAGNREYDSTKALIKDHPEIYASSRYFDYRIVRKTVVTEVVEG